MAEIILTKNRIAVVDDRLFEHLSKWRWKYGTNGYATRTVYIGRIEGVQKTSQVLMHRAVWEIEYGSCPEDKVIDHIDRNPLNNTIENLRALTQQQNTYNSDRSTASGYKFVEFHEYSKNNRCVVKRTKPYRARVTFNGKRKSLGFYESAVEAHEIAVKFLKNNGILF